MPTLRKIIYLFIFVIILLLIPSTHPLKAVKCDEWVAGEIHENLSLSFPNLQVKGEIKEGRCIQDCGTSGKRAVANPIERFQYRFDNVGSWIDFDGPREGGEWWLKKPASPTDCVRDLGGSYQSFIYGFDAIISISHLSPGDHILNLKATYEIERSWEETSFFTVPPVNRPPNVPELIAPPHNTWINYSPTFQARVSDPNPHDTLRAEFAILEYTHYLGNWVNNNEISSVGPISIPDGQYWWKARAQDNSRKLLPQQPFIIVSQTQKCYGML